MVKNSLNFPKVSIAPMFAFVNSIPVRKKRVSKRSLSFAKAIRPILISLMAVGIQTTSYSKPSSLNMKSLPLKWWNLVALAYLHLFSLKTIVIMFLTTGGLGFWMQLTTFLKSSFATVCADIYILKRNKIHILIRKICKVFDRLSPEDKKKFRYRIVGIASVLWMFMILNIIILMASIYKMGMSKFLKIHFFSMRLGFSDTIFLYIIGSILFLIRQAITWGTLAFMIMLYVFICDSLRLCFRSYNLNLISTFRDTYSVDETIVKTLENRFVYISELLALTDDIFSPAVFLWSTGFVLSICIDTTFDISSYHRMNFLVFLDSMLKMFRLTLAFMGIGFSAALAMEEAHRSLSSFYQATAKFDTSKNGHVHREMQFFAMQLATTRLSLTGWKFFELTRGYMLTVVGILASYIIIIIQWNPDAVVSIIKG